MKFSGYLILSFLLLQTAAMAQFAPQAGVAGSTAISKASPLFKGWATGCQVSRGWLNIADPSQGYVTAGDNTKGMGMPDNAIVSLGDSGTAVLTFATPIYNGQGPDFAVFENGFSNPADPEMAFLELAFVEVSSDGTNYFRFPAASYIPEDPQILAAGVYTNARYINNLAGKYAGANGTPFDLEELKDKPGLDVNNITHIRLIDVVGSVTAHFSLDTGGRKINDPYPTPFAGGGFDLDAVGAIHLRGVNVSDIADRGQVHIYPNPVTDILSVVISNESPVKVMICDAMGKALYSGSLSSRENQLSFSAYAQGIYYLHFSDTKGNKWVEKISRL